MTLVSSVDDGNLIEPFIYFLSRLYSADVTSRGPTCLSVHCWQHPDKAELSLANSMQHRPARFHPDIFRLFFSDSWGVCGVQFFLNVFSKGLLLFFPSWTLLLSSLSFISLYSYSYFGGFLYPVSVSSQRLFLMEDTLRYNLQYNCQGATKCFRSTQSVCGFRATTNW